MPPDGDDVWAGVQTRHGLAADEVISALQKEIRRGHTENAARLAYEMLVTSEALEAKLWQRLQIISVEDIGYGDLNAPVLVHTLFQMHQSFPRPQGDRYLLALHAVRFLCRCPKDRSSDEFFSWIKRTSDADAQRPSVPDYALDRHTAAGRRPGGGWAAASVTFPNTALKWSRNWPAVKPSIASGCWRCWTPPTMRSTTTKPASKTGRRIRWYKLETNGGAQGAARILPATRPGPGMPSPRASALSPGVTAPAAWPSTCH